MTGKKTDEQIEQREQEELRDLDVHEVQADDVRGGIRDLASARLWSAATGGKHYTEGV
jgi:hypothetical protein